MTSKFLGSFFSMISVNLYIDKIWRMNDKFYMKWKCKVIHLV